MKNKLAIIGRGTAGCFALSHFMRWTDWDIDLYYDPNIPQQAVGEGSTLSLPTALSDNINLTWSDLSKIDGSFKYGIKKNGWGSGKEYIHHFKLPNVSIHFNAIALQNYILNFFNDNKRLNIIEKNTTHDVDADYVMDCSGKPDSYEDFYELNSIPVNAVHVTQCYWDEPKFDYTLTIARPYGWVFGIPLKTRCSIGYMYNHNINTLDEVKEDVKQIFKDYNLIASNNTNSFKFNNYYRKKNFDGRICYNGNSSFFLEPIEATSIGTMNFIQQSAAKIWSRKPIHPNVENQYNKLYIDKMKEVENMIMLHYYAGSIYNTPFWNIAKARGESNIQEALKNKSFVDTVKRAAKYKTTRNDPRHNNDYYEYGQWGQSSYLENIIGLDIEHIFNKV